MNQNLNNTSQDQEIDLSIISKKISGFFDSILMTIFRIIRFFVKNAVLVLVLVVLGAVLGYFLDNENKSFKHEIIVTPNFGSYDYLYNKVELIQSKINQNDTLFLKSIGIKNPKDFKSIKIEPIIDLYLFVNDKTNATNNAQNSQNFEMVKLLSEDGDINKVAKDKVTSKNYYNHSLEIKTSGYATNKSLIEPIIKYLNKSEFFTKYQTIFTANIIQKIKDNQIIIAQIDLLLNGFSSSTSSNQKNNNLVYYNENTQLNDVLKTKSDLINEISYKRLELISNSEVIKEKSRVINLKDNKGINNKLKLILPILFILIFLVIVNFRNFYRKQTNKFNSQT
jgi:hypothetical protein